MLTLFLQLKGRLGGTLNSTLRLAFLCSFLFLTACSNVNFSNEVQDSASTDPAAPSVAPGAATEAPKASVQYPFEFEIENSPYLGILTHVEMKYENGSCSLISETRPIGDNFCDLDPALSDFCSTEVITTLTPASDFTCLRTQKAAAVKAARGSCVARTAPLDASDLKELADQNKYEIVQTGPAEPGDISDLPLEGLQITKISLTADCKCSYDSVLKSRWPALSSHCQKYFPEYR
jgi:hypothetical protein